MEQLDLALEHVSKRDIHNARFGLMLTDNAVELVLHQIAKDKAADFAGPFGRQKDYAHREVLDRALKRSFEDKVKFARLDGKLDEETARTVMIMHDFRNEVYHVGIKHEPILPDLAIWYFEVACSFLGKYHPKWFGWSSNMNMPARAQRHFRGNPLFPGGMQDFSDGCLTLLRECAHDPRKTISALADHMDSVVKEQDDCISLIAEGIYEGRQRTRDKAVLECQAERIAFTPDARKFLGERYNSEDMFGVIVHLMEGYSFAIRGDPIPSWRRQVARLRAQHNVHRALFNYHSFMSSTAIVRDAIEEEALLVDGEIDRLIDEARGG